MQVHDNAITKVRADPDKPKNRKVKQGKYFVLTFTILYLLYLILLLTNELTYKNATFHSAETRVDIKLRRGVFDDDLQDDLDGARRSGDLPPPSIKEDGIGK